MEDETTVMEKEKNTKATQDTIILLVTHRLEPRNPEDRLTT